MSAKATMREAVGVLRSELRTRGFYGKGRKFYRTAGEFQQLLEVQVSRRSTHERVELDVNCGLVIRPLFEGRDPDAPEYTECHWAWRLFGGDFGFKLSRGDDGVAVGQKLARRVVEEAVPRLAELSNMDRLRTEWAAGRGPGLTSEVRQLLLGRLCLLVGDVPGALEVAREIESRGGSFAAQDAARLRALAGEGD